MNWLKQFVSRRRCYDELSESIRMGEPGASSIADVDPGYHRRDIPCQADDARNLRTKRSDHDVHNVAFAALVPMCSSSGHVFTDAEQQLKPMPPRLLIGVVYRSESTRSSVRQFLQPSTSSPSRHAWRCRFC